MKTFSLVTFVFIIYVPTISGQIPYDSLFVEKFRKSSNRQFFDKDFSSDRSQSLSSRKHGAIIYRANKEVLSIGEVQELMEVDEDAYKKNISAQFLAGSRKTALTCLLNNRDKT
jgi:hypothetical protein